MTDVFYTFALDFKIHQNLKIFFMAKNKKIIIYLSIIALLDMVIPIPFTALMLIYVILEKPAWFKNLVTDIYDFP